MSTLVQTVFEELKDKSEMTGSYMGIKQKVGSTFVLARHPAHTGIFGNSWQFWWSCTEVFLQQKPSNINLP